MKNDDVYFRLEKINHELLYTLGLTKSLEEKLNRNSENHYLSSETTLEFITLLKKLNNIVISNLEWRLFLDFRDLSSQKKPNLYAILKLQKVIHFANYFIMVLFKFMEFIDEAKANNIPWRIYGQVQRYCQLLLPNSKVLLLPVNEYNFGYTPLTKVLRRCALRATPLDPLLSKALLLELQNSHFFVAFSFPETEFSNTLNLAVWGHEFGHFFDHVLSPDLDENYSINIFNSKLKFTLTEENHRLIQIVKEALAFSQTEQSSSHKIPDLSRIQKDIALRLINDLKEWIKEIFADFIALRLLGPAGYFALAEMIQMNDDEPSEYFKGRKSHPLKEIRLKILTEAFEQWNKKDDLLNDLPKSIISVISKEINYYRKSLANISQSIYSSYNNEVEDEDADLLTVFSEVVLTDILQTLVSKLQIQIDNLPQSQINRFIKQSEIIKAYKLCTFLKNKQPPNFSSLSENQMHGEALSTIFNCGWLFWLQKRHESIFQKYSDLEDLLLERNTINSLIAKSFEIIDTQIHFSERQNYLNFELLSEEEEHNKYPNNKLLNNAKSLRKDSLLERIDTNEMSLIPLLDRQKQISDDSIDIRLGNEFITTKVQTVTSIDPCEINPQLHKIQTKQYVPFGKPFVLHPNHFILGSTLEYICMPNDLLALVLGRSSWGRLGLIIATASKVDPGFKGCITLEITNLANVPILLYPGSRIGQLNFLYIDK